MSMSCAAGLKQWHLPGCINVYDALLQMGECQTHFHQVLRI